MSLKELEDRMDTAMYQEPELKWKKPAKVKKLEKNSMKKPDHVLVEYLTRNYTVRRMLCKLISGDLVIVDNKVHIINPRDSWRDGKFIWYKIREIDRLSISNRDYDKLLQQKRLTVNDAPIIKAILGAVQQQQKPLEKKKWLILIIIIAVIGVGAYLLFGR